MLKKRKASNDPVLPHELIHDDFITTMSSVFYWVRWVGIVGSGRLKWKLYGLLLFSLMLAIEGQSIKKLVRALTGLAVDISGHRSVAARIEGLMFYTAVLLGLIQSNRLSHSWSDASVFWASTEGAFSFQYMPSDRTLKKNMYRVTFGLLLSGGVVYLLDALFAINFQCELPLCLKEIVLKTHAFMLRESEYSDGVGILIICMSMIANIVWILQDLLIILICMGLTSRYQRLNECVARAVTRSNRRKNMWCKDTELVQVHTWRKIRKAYITQAMLVRRVDNSLGGLILVSNFFNFYFTCLQLFYGIVQGISNDEMNFYFLIDLIWVGGRTIYTVLSAADVNNHSKLALPYLYECHNTFYNVEVERLQKQLTKNDVTLTGLGFYNINRSTVLQMIGSIVTYVLVLVQYDASDV